MSAERNYEAERLERERIWQERREAGGVNTISPHSGYIDWRTIPGMMKGLRSSGHPAAPALEQWFGELVEKQGGSE